MNKKRSNVSASNIVFALIFVGVILWAIYYTQPLKENVETLEVEKTQNELKLEQVEKRLADLQELKKNLPTSDAARQKLLDSVPLERDQEGVLNDLEQIALANNIQLSVFSFTESEGESQAIKVLNLMAGFVGTYEDLINFLEGVEANIREFNVTSVNVQLTEEVDSEIGVMNFTLGIEAYYQVAS